VRPPRSGVPFATVPKKRLSSDQKLKWGYEAAYNILMTQLSLGGVLDDEENAVSQLVSDFGFGYVFGFVRTIMTGVGVDDEPEALAPHFEYVFGKLFGAERGPKIFATCVDLAGDSEFRAAALLGTAEVHEWLADPDEKAPQGLATYLNKGRAAQLSS
jgi:hypothetical protein